MAKNLLQDIKPITRKPRDTSNEDSMVVRVPPKAPVAPEAPAPSPSPREEASYEQGDEEAPVNRMRQSQISHDIPFEPIEPRHSSRYALWYIAAAAVVAFLFSLSFLFEHATITITPKSVPVSFDATDVFTAQKDSTDDGVISFTQMSLSGDESIKIPGTQSNSQSGTATGRVVLYNEYSRAPYKLVKSTRLQSTAGNIYRIDSSVTIPGFTTNGTTVTPGSIEVDVTAAAAGEASNLDAGDFSIPGLAGTPQGKKIYGRTKTAIAGGISGNVYTVPQDVAVAAYGTLQQKLKTSLMAKAKVQVPDGYLFFEGATLFTSDDAVQIPISKDQQVPLALHGTLTAYLIKEDTLVSAIATKSVSQYAGEPVTMPNISSLMLIPAVVIAPDVDTSFNFTFNGSSDVLWTVDTDGIKTLLAGKKKSDFESLLGTVPSVERAEVILKPFWKRSFPEDPTHITVTVK